MAAIPVSLQIVDFQERRGLVDVVAREASPRPERDELERFVRVLDRRRPHEQLNCLLDETADRRARLGGALLQLGQEPVVERYRGPHDA